MRTPSPVRSDDFPGRPEVPAPERLRSLTSRANGPSAAGGARQSRLLVVVEDGFDGRAVDAILRREYREVMMDSPDDTIVRRVKSEKFDAVVVCSKQPGGRVMELLDRITLGNPGLPVIVVIDPGPAVTRSLPQGLLASAAAPAIDAGLLLRSVWKALSEPKVKRLIRLTGSRGEPRFVARNARWLSENLQARYSMPFDWTPAEVPIPLPITGTTAVSPQSL